MGIVEKQEQSKHNEAWMNSNFKYARKFAKENDPFRIVEALNNENLFNEKPVLYNNWDHSILKIKAYPVYLSFALSYAINHKNTNGGFALQYDLDPYEFRLKCDKALKKFNSLSEFILEGTKLSCLPLEKAWDVSKFL